MDTKNISLDSLLAEITGLKEIIGNQEIRIKKLEGLISSEGSALKPASNMKKTIHLYIDLDDVIFEQIADYENKGISHKFRDGTVEFLYWCIDNFHCYWLTKLDKPYLDQLITLENAEQLFEIEYVEITGKKSKPAAIDKYKDFYWLTTHKGNSAINEMLDDYYGYRKLSIKEQPINDIKQVLFEKLYRRADVKFSGVGQSRPKGVGWADGSYVRGGNVYLLFEIKDEFRLVFETREKFLFHIYWRLDITKKKESKDIRVSKGMESFIHDIENELLPILEKLSKKKYGEFF